MPHSQPTVSELRWPALFFALFFPVLGNDFGLGALGLFQVLCVFTFIPRRAPSVLR